MSVFLTSQLALPGFAAIFTDVSGHWAQPAIERLSQQNIISGYPNGQFRPEGQVTRAEFASMLVRALHLNPNAGYGGASFADVPPNFWGYPAIQAVSSRGLVSGYPGGYFRPNQNISRAESMAILVKAANAPIPNAAQTGQILSRFGDASQIPQWAAPAVAAAIQSGIFANFPSNNLVEPNQPATRAEVAVMTDHLENYLANGAPSGEYTSNTGGYTTGSATQQGNTIQGHVSVVPANTTFTAVVTQPISSEANRVGDPISLTLDRPLLSAAGDIVVPQNSQLLGSITAIDPAGRAEKNAGVTFDFNRIVTPDGRTFPLSAQVNTTNGILKGGTTKGRVGKVALKGVGGAAVGGAAGAILGAIKGHGKADDYLARGAVIGGAVGTGAALLGKGNPVILQPGERLDIRLRQPLTVSDTTLQP